MPALPALSVFMLASLILLLTPGPAVLYIITRSIEQGRRAGLVSVLSIETGNFCHVLAVTFGLSAILQSSELAFTIVKYLGAAYLVFLGLQRLLTQATPRAETDIKRLRLRQVYSQGVMVAILNPKTALFFLAFLPQFVDAGRNSVVFQLFVLGCIFVGMAIVTDSLYALLAGTAGEWLKNNPTFPLVERYVVGCIYVGLGAATALTSISTS
jgi:threonine/homoserine/homoserine lactone efflux protein